MFFSYKPTHNWTDKACDQNLLYISPSSVIASEKGYSRVPSIWNIGNVSNMLEGRERDYLLSLVQTLSHPKHFLRVQITEQSTLFYSYSFACKFSSVCCCDFLWKLLRPVGSRCFYVICCHCLLIKLWNHLCVGILFLHLCVSVWSLCAWKLSMVEINGGILK